MSSIELEIQKEWNFCFCSALQTIFKKHDIKISQEDIANNLTPSTNGFLVDDFKIREFMKRNGFSYDFYWNNETPFNEPDILLNEMNEHNGILGIKNHVYLLKYFKDPKIEMINPESGKVIQTDIYQTLREMENTYGFFGLIKYIH
ncbi:MAG: hypothetical protein KJI69_06510 [Patescibacteria group bacterium]|nr:hypothetical protein [Patescibacteria group bacterium]